MKRVNKLFSILFVVQVVCFAILFSTLINLNGILAKSDLVSRFEVSKMLYISAGLFFMTIMLFTIHSVQARRNRLAVKEAQDNTNKKREEEAKSAEKALYEQKNEERKHKLKTLLQKEKAAPTLFETFTRFMTNELSGCQGAFFKVKSVDNKNVLSWNAGYAFYVPEDKPLTYDFGEGLTGQAAKDKRLMNLKNVKIDNVVVSGLGKTNPENLIICPILNNNEVFGVIEIASFTAFSEYDEEFITSAANMLIISMN